MKDVLLAATATKNLALNVLALYGYLAIFSFLFLLPVLLGWEPTVNGVTHHFDTSSYLDVRSIVLNLFSSLLAIRVSVKGFFPVLALGKKTGAHPEDVEIATK